MRSGFIQIHRKIATAEDVRLLHTANGRQPQLHQSHEVIGNFVWLQNVRRKAQIR